MKPENKFRQWFLDKFTLHMFGNYTGARVTVQKHADYATTGIADIDLSINGITMWIEVKLLTSCKEERKLHVTPIQRAYLENRAKGGVPTGLLVGLALGPRKGYLVALFVPPISEVVHRSMFRPYDQVVERIYSMANAAAHRSVQDFERLTVPRSGPTDFARLDVSRTLPCEDVECTDVAGEDGG